MIFTLTPKDSITETIKLTNFGDIIILKSGIYHEKVEIHKSGISVVGEKNGTIIIENNDYFYKIMQDFNECNTFRTFTFFVKGDNVTLKNLTIRNTSTPSSVYGQAVSLHVSGDKFTCENCFIESAQDTLFTGPMPDNIIERYSNTGYPEYILSNKPTKQIYKRCKIKGDVDFIFGGATALFENCEIISVNRGKEDPNIPCYIAAPSHIESLKYGYLFLNCNLVSENTKTFLARPWRDYGTAAFINCKLNDCIIPEGFNKWEGSERDKTARFFEYSPGFDTSKRVSWSHQLNENEANCYVKDFLEFINK